MKPALILAIAFLLAGVPLLAFDTTVNTEPGLIRGRVDHEGTIVWKGIPYAQPPVGDLRWRAPKPVRPWDGVFEANRFGSPALQYSPISRRILGSEDCLYLNIWRPDSEERDLPVYVWIHGGGNSMGSANQVPDYYGHAVAARSNMVFVSINYRLGPFGWFLHPSLAAGASDAGQSGRDIDTVGRNPAAEDASGNYGTLDIIEALRWIQANIAAFGGDPETVLIAGESAGAMNVLSLMLAPQAEGLFSHALVQSGVLRMSEPKEGENIGLLIESELLGVTSDAPPVADIRAALSDTGGREIMRIFDPRGFGMLGLPHIFADGHVLPAEGYDALREGNYPSKVPVIIGSNQDEVKLFRAGDRALRRDEDLYHAITRYDSDMWKVDGVDSVARLLAASPDQPAVFVYHFRWGALGEDGRSELPGNKGLRYGAFHSLEVPFFLGTDSIHGPLTIRFFRRSNREGRHELSSAMMSYVSEFVRTGRPGAGNTALPEWQPWSNDSGGPKSLVLDHRDGAPAITMMTREYTADSVRASVTAEYPPEIARAVLDRTTE